MFAVVGVWYALTVSSTTVCLCLHWKFVERATLNGNACRIVGKLNNHSVTDCIPYLRTLYAFEPASRHMTRVLIVGAGITGAVTASLLKCRLPQNSHIAVWEICKQSGWFPLSLCCLINMNVGQYIHLFSL